MNETEQAVVRAGWYFVDWGRPMMVPVQFRQPPKKVPDAIERGEHKETALKEIEP